MIKDLLDLLKFAKENFWGGPRIKLARSSCLSFKYPPGSNTKYIDPKNHWVTYSLSYTLENRGEGTDVSENLLTIVDPSTDEIVAILSGQVAANSGVPLATGVTKAVGKNESKDFWFQVEQKWQTGAFESHKHLLMLKFVKHRPITAELSVNFKTP